MVTEELIRKQFIHQILKRDSAYIYETQARVIRKNFSNERAKELAIFLASRPFRISGEGLKPTYYFQYSLIFVSWISSTAANRRGYGNVWHYITESYGEDFIMKP